MKLLRSTRVCFNAWSSGESTVCCRATCGAREVLVCLTSLSSHLCLCVLDTIDHSHCVQTEMQALVCSL